MAKIECPDDLPSWYSLEKYAACASFDALQWLHQLERRSELLKLHPDFFITEQPEDDLLKSVAMCIWKGTLTEDATALRNDPTGSTSEIESATPPVRDVFVLDLWRQAYLDEIENRKGKLSPEKAERWRVIGDNSAKLNDWLKSKHSTIEIDHYRPNTPPAPVITVDMRATDSVLIDAFTNWLKEKRKHQAFAFSKREKPAYKDWARYGLLPYIDLMTWAKEHNHNIPHNFMAQAVGYVKGGDSFRKTVPKLAGELMRDLSELEALAALESAAE